MRRIVIVKRSVLLLYLLIFCFVFIGGVGFAAASVYQNVAVDKKEGKQLPVLMYHSILKNKKAAGKYVISPEVLEADLKYLRDNGYTTVLSADLIAYENGQADLPEKPIMITFDDGYLNNLTYALPLLEKYDMKAVISIVGSFSERFSINKDPNPNYAHLSWEEIRQLADTGRIEIGNHTYAMHAQSPRKGCAKKRGESDAEYRKALIEDITKTQQLLKENCGIEPTIFTYPFGSVCNDSLPIIAEMGFKVSLSCCEKNNVLTRESDDLLLMCRFNRPSGISTEKFMQRIL